MLVKLTFEVNFMNMLTCSFYICTCLHALAPDFYFTNNTSPNYGDQFIQLEVMNIFMHCALRQWFSTLKHGGPIRIK